MRTGIQNLQKYQHIALICLIMTYGCYCLAEVESQQMKRIRERQQQIFSNNTFLYNQNTQQVAFPLIYHTNDFIVKIDADEEIKFVLRAFSKKGNVYSPSKYAEGENIRIMVYEGSANRIVFESFYQSYAVKFNAKKDIPYSIRFVYSGPVAKVVTMELNKRLSLPGNIQTKNRETFGERMLGLAYQLQAIIYSTSFTDTVHIQNSNIVNDGIDMYMTYLIIQAVIVLIIVGVQVKMLTRMLKTDIII